MMTEFIFIFDISLKLHSNCSLLSFLASLQPKEAVAVTCAVCMFALHSKT